jgi:hypothetical protein
MIYDLSKPYDANKFKARLKTLKDKKVELTEIREKRTLTQNSYLHVCISIFAIEFGYTLDEAKTLLKRNCSFMVYEKNGDKFLKRTRGMDSKELTDFIDWIRDYSGMQGCYIPTPDEYRQNKRQIDDHISSHKRYL